ncbi:hypothetical protein GGX14DRAFT_384340 [Mycena pura]|uniref:Uncharacterized protein n=1 Tax=Mycena pura TaxID=153505 RepID=A0AAD7E5V1_9AGAR|nr:hypothetical protein GGX14DRAFT_384340 [Mycena pura]
MRSCLKSPSIPGSPDPGHCCRKNVAFGTEVAEEVHWADEWDRTPTEPCRQLSYQELLELKEIQQSLPHAAQPHDRFHPGARRQLLSTVPIGLLPLGVGADTCTPPSTPSTPSSPPPPEPSFTMPPGRARPAPPLRLASPALAHLRPPAQQPPPPRPAFAILPLMDPGASHAAPATPPASSVSYFPPYSPERAAADGEPDRVLLAPRTRPVPIPTTGAGAGARKYGSGYAASYRAAEAAAYSPPFGSSAYDYKRDKQGMLDGPRPGAGRRKKKKTSVILINDVEMEIEEEGSSDESDRDADAVDREASARKPPTTMAPNPLCPATAKPASPPPPISVSASPPMARERLPTAAPESTASKPTSPRLATRPLSPRSTKVAPLTPRPHSPNASPTAAGRLSPMQARASSRLVRSG